MGTQNRSPKKVKSDWEALISGAIAVLFIGAIWFCCCGGAGEFSDYKWSSDDELRERRRENLEKEYPWLK